MIRLFSGRAVPLLVVLLAASPARTMELNVAVPWNPDTSAKENKAVHDAHIDFYSCSAPDLLFTDGQEIVIEARPPTLRAVAMSYGVSRNMFKQPFLTGEAEALPAARFLIRVPTERLTPGFYDINVVLDCGEKEPYRTKCTFGWKVSELPITPDQPADFEAFWKKGKAELAGVPLDAHVGDFQTFDARQIDDYNVTSACLPPDYDPKGHRTEVVESAKVDFAGLGKVRIHGWLAKPPGSGPFPAMLILPGAGFNARPRPLEHARHGFLALDIQIHGQEVDLPGPYPTIPGYQGDVVYTTPEQCYFHNVYLNCVQAINYLASRPDVDKSRIVVVGGSQGGRLAITLAGLDARVAATCPAIVWNGNLPYHAWAEAANQATPPQDGMDRRAPPPLPDTPEGRVAGYYDDMNFAPQIRCPVFMNAGLIDPISPPSSSWAIFNRIGSKDKTITPLPGQAHDWSAEFDRRAWRWLDRELALQPVPGPALKPAGP